MSPVNPSITSVLEVALRVHDLNRMRRFYEDVIGLALIPGNHNGDPDQDVVFYAVGPGGHHLALFDEKLMDWYTRDKSPLSDPKLTTLSHFALSIALADFESEKQRLEALGIEILYTNASRWLHCRMFYFFDPEGNLIEFNSRDDSLQ